MSGEAPKGVGVGKWQSHTTQSLHLLFETCRKHIHNTLLLPRWGVVIWRPTSSASEH
ncbi:hypothetical protein L3Y25_gp044 [Gordonia phage Syleon]|uniref:Uncharacterized protein n=3 Tax=Octobienvirus TaxID=3044779 RepID=A0AAE8Y6B6_9CAUD|nr:hypothetical protein L3Y23_gp044 [Gordonia Phage Sephiroth]YP_010246562.1 hypothetical protein L3Y24_gp043 [Gordonia phage Kudefre]YP_010246703.1 hypothetical protein L3Y25_gp044 [Gordonia phage Syleon]QGH75773.1 hypothetical protein SEA_SYLEON_44 [Gordonia phage Syleon]QNN99388.1 hypothetical protein SEA_SEPHIROTH_44 [Gordonia Phage Sephiroth]UDL15362.1 hypothetical protein SEA_KUDEFRE_43 [Gordonia phage Kudefre]